MISPPDNELIAAVEAGKDAAIASFCSTYGPWAEAVARSRRVPPEDARDIAQEWMISVVRQLQAHTFRGDSQVGTWMLAILKNKVTDWERSCGHRLARLGSVRDIESLTSAGQEPQGHTPDPEARAVVLDVLRRLPPPWRTVLLLNQAEGLSTREIAKVLRRSEGRVGVLLWEAKQRLRDLLRKEIPAGPRLIEHKDHD